MGILKRAKKDDESQSISDSTGSQKLKIKEIEETQLEATRNELSYAKKELEETIVKVDSALYKLKDIQTEHNAKSNELEKIKSELEEKKSRLSEVTSNHEAISSDVKIAKDELAFIKSQYDQNEVDNIKQKIESARSKFSEVDSQKEYAIAQLEDLNSHIGHAKFELQSLLTQQETKKKEINTVRRELEFIERELASAGQKDETKKIVEAAGVVVASINAKYEAIKKELEIIKISHARLKTDYESVKKELESFQSRVR